LHGNPGEDLLPGRGISGSLVGVVRRIGSRQSAPYSVLPHGEIVDGGHQHRAVRGLDLQRRHAAKGGTIPAEVREGGESDLVGPAQQGEHGAVWLVVDDVLELGVPVTLPLVPTGSGTSLRHHEVAARVVDVDELPVAVPDVTEAAELG